MKTFIKRLTAALFFCVPAALQAQQSESQAEISAESILYDRAGDTVYAEGNVKVRYKDMRFTADRIEYNRATSEVTAWGNIEFSRKEYTLDAARMTYSLISSTGVVLDARIASSPFYVQAERILITGTNEFNIPSGNVTTCDHDPPHYRLSGSNIDLQLGSRLSAWSTMLYIRGAPSFYYPYYFKNLAPDKLKFSFDAGSSDSSGLYLKVKAAYPFTENSEAYVGVDLMTVKGVGLRVGHKFESSRGKSETEAYYIKEADTKLQRGRIFVRGWQNPVNGLNINYRTEYASHRRFGYEYDREHMDYDQRNLYYQLGFDLARSRYQAALYADRREVWQDGDYTLENYVLPGALLRLSPLSLPGRVIFTAETGYRNQRTVTHDSWRSDLMWKGNLRGAYRLYSRGNYHLSFSPGAGYDGLWQEGDFIKHYVNLEAGIRQGFFNKVFLGNNYIWRREAEAPYAIVRSMISNELTVTPFRGLMLSSRASYDFREGIENPVGDIFTYAEYRHGRNRYHLMNRYDYHGNRPLDWLFEGSRAGFSETRVRYNYQHPDRLELSQRFEIRVGNFMFMPGARMHFEKSPVAYSFSGVIEQSLSVVWDMHCWQSQLRAVKRGRESELWLLFNIMAFPERKVGVYGSLREEDEGVHSDLKFHRE